MSFQCPKCKSWNTHERNKKSVCYDCYSFYEMGTPEVNWKNVKSFVIIFITLLTIFYSIKYYFNLMYK